MQDEFVISKNLLFVVLAALLALGAATYIVFSPLAVNPGKQDIGFSCGGKAASGGCGAALPSNPVAGNTNQPTAQISGNTQEISIHALPTGLYDKPTITVKAGIPVRLTFVAEQGSGCGQLLVMEDFNVNLISRNGAAVTAEFTPTKPGEYAYHCGMWMFKGKLIVVN